jgi:uncharacterized surface protein with fasciclin (FAS1) repeats
MKNMKKGMRTILYFIMAMGLITMAACKKLSSFDYPPTAGTNLQIISNDNNFSTFKYALDKTGLGDLLKGTDEYTVFAPNNNAFIIGGYPLATLQSMTSADVAVLVKNHIVAGKMDVSSLGASTDKETLSGLKITIQNMGGLSYVNGGDILNASINASNGYFNATNLVLSSYPNLNDAVKNYINGTSNSQLTFLAAAILRASTGSTNFTSLLSGSTPYTLLAPNNGAFIDAGYASIAAINAATPDVIGNLLKYQLLPGVKLTTAFDSVPVTSYNGTPIYFDYIKRNVTPTVTIATNVSLWYANGITFGNSNPSNLRAGNGVMHIVSRFLPVPVTTNTLDRIKADPNLTMFLALIKRASTADPLWNFESILADPAKSYTVFAVNNTGLQAAGYADVAAINAESPGVLASILKLHMINKSINNINIIDNGAVMTLAGSNITFILTGGFKVQGPANSTSIPVITANTVTTNGILNIIGAVIKP